MTEQNFSNHKRYHPGYHFFITPLALTGCILSGIHLAKAGAENHYNAALIFLAFFLILCVTAITRAYALKVQNRVIRAEENFRHFILTGKPLDSRLRMGQIIALRFASDEEFPGLAQRSITDNLTVMDIKKSIQNWRADYKRI
ncbi:MAG: DUF6526 family protein [Bacteroidota bacterium]|jgi:hypothetical protein